MSPSEVQKCRKVDQAACSETTGNVADFFWTQQTNKETKRTKPYIEAACCLEIFVHYIRELRYKQRNMGYHKDFEILISDTAAIYA